MDKLTRRAQRTYNWALRQEASRDLAPDLRRMLSDLRQRIGSLLDPRQNLNMAPEERERFLLDRIEESERLAEEWGLRGFPA